MASKVDSLPTAASGSNDDSTSSIKVTYRGDRSIPMFMVQSFIRPFNTFIAKSRHVRPPGSQKLEGSSAARKKLNIEERVVEEMYLYDLVPKSTSQSNTEGRLRKKRLFYFAGGAWQMVRI